MRVDLIGHVPLVKRARDQHRLRRRTQPLTHPELLCRGRCALAVRLGDDACRCSAALRERESKALEVVYDARTIPTAAHADALFHS